MKFVRFISAGKESYGVLEGDSIRVVQGDIFTQYEVTKERRKVSEVSLTYPCVPPKIVAVGLNYRSHLGDRPVPTEPVLFLKATTALLAPEGTIVMPKGTGRVDSEGELVVVMKSRTKGVSEADALQDVLGYTCGNDVSARVYQRNDGQWMRAKSIDTFAPLGPCIATDVNPGTINLTTRINGKVVQHQNTGDLIFSVPFLISFISRFITLLPGDVIYTGTPGTTEAMKSGDVVEVDLEGIGVLRNFVKEE
jgi:2-keto-4-pentenoate hydratase/2-oxohepta-3-ene-1,7-dioic acid hydratase in catechol pathway